VLQAANGSEALSLLDRNRPDLVLCDITMPGIGGYDVLKALREQGDMSDVPFIFLTALAERNDVLTGSRRGGTTTSSSRSIMKSCSRPFRPASTR
jgi:CheY-like chemotaxis protein